MEYLTGDCEFDWVYLVVSPQNPLKDASKALTGEQRYQAAVEAVCRHPELHVWVDDIELTMPSPQYTCRTLDALKAREPENEFTLIIGADNLAGFRKWDHYPRILLEYGLAVYPRRGYDIDALRRSFLEENPDYRISVLDHAPIVDMSSTQIREAQADGKDMSEYLM